MTPEEEVLKIKEFQKAQICYLVLKVLCVNMPMAYTSNDLGSFSRDMQLKSKLEDAGTRITKLVDEIGKPFLDKYLLDKEWCAAHRFTKEEQRAATKEVIGEEWDLDKVSQYIDNHSH